MNPLCLLYTTCFIRSYFTDAQGQWSFALTPDGTRFDVRPDPRIEQTQWAPVTDWGAPSASVAVVVTPEPGTLGMMVAVVLCAALSIGVRAVTRRGR